MIPGAEYSPAATDPIIDAGSWKMRFYYDQGPTGIQGPVGNVGACGASGRALGQTYNIGGANGYATDGEPNADGEYALFDDINCTGNIILPGYDWGNARSMKMFVSSADGGADLGVSMGNAYFNEPKHIKLWKRTEPYSNFLTFEIIEDAEQDPVNITQINLNDITVTSYRGKLPEQYDQIKLVTNAEYIGAEGLEGDQGDDGPTGACGPQGAACFIAGTMIHTVSGPKKIEDIVDGDKVKSVAIDKETSKKKEVIGTVKDKVSHGPTEKLVNIEYGDGSLECTPDHFIFTPDGSVKEAKDFKIGDTLVNVTKKNVSIITSIKSAPAQPTYNFEVTPYENYVANDILVHNMAFQKLEYLHQASTSDDWVPMYNTNAGQWKSQPIHMPWWFHGQRANASNSTTDHEIVRAYHLGSSTSDLDPISNETNLEYYTMTAPCNITIAGYYVTLTDDAVMPNWSGSSKIQVYSTGGVNDQNDFSGSHYPFENLPGHGVAEGFDVDPHVIVPNATSPYYTFDFVADNDVHHNMGRRK